MGYLWGGEILRVNLTTGEIRKEPTAPYAERLVGSRGINSLLLYETVGPEVRPLEPGNRLIFGTGPLTGTLFPGSCRTDVLAKSPVTGAIGNASIGGYWGPELKFAGYDHLVVEGKADRPVYLAIRDETVEIRSAESLWGKDCFETPGALRKEIGDRRVQTVCIGPAGERQVLYSTINSSMGSVAARTGLGAVMGSKNLKAIAVRGSRGVQAADPSAFLAGCERLHQLIRSTPMYHELHTFGLTKWQDKEYRAIYSMMGEPWAESLRLQEFMETNLYKRVGCFGCPVSCMDSYQISQGSGVVKCSPYADLTWDLRNPDLLVFWEVMVMCQRYGVDARSMANVIAWTMELYERGIITEDDTDGLPVKYGSKEAILEMARKIIQRERIGDLLADGLVEAAQRIGRGSEEYLLHSKGSPIDTHIPPLRGVSLATAVSATGEGIKGCIVSEFGTALTIGQTQDEAKIQKALERWQENARQVAGSPQAADPRLNEGKAAYVRHNEDQNGLGDIVGVCTWMTAFMGLPINVEHMAELIAIGSGTPTSTERLFQAVAQTRHLQRAYEIREGMTRAQDILPQRFYQQIKPEMAATSRVALSPEELERLKDEYYQLRGWDVQTGAPRRETLERAGLPEVAADLARRGLI
ncbi:MAG: hypothetical protein HYY20_08690 [Candidatus Tectomicrobia bacterium]|uniref:Aldehyde ferredoxin oxidoreductase N-terminal domain-containing protein n=1 Tax=Tectimicrobiota bacterium TaxID=2528274 RepID=A0A932FVP1_UNCTE|nr:hypothetical protein [Candidatus Tectomicrobia bacterium]